MRNCMLIYYITKLERIERLNNNVINILGGRTSGERIILRTDEIGTQNPKRIFRW